MFQLLWLLPHKDCEGVIPINLEAETGKLLRIGEMDVRHSVELIQGGVRCLCLQLSARKLV
jgi:hypothetical protein